MFTFTKSRPSAGLVVAIVALFMAIGGTGYAASSISGKTLKKRSVPADRIKNDALTGVQVNESRLGQVPQAALAQSALLAKQADSAKDADHARSADTAKLADDAKLLNGKAATAFMANDVHVRVGQGPTVPGTGGGVPSTASANCLPTEKGIGGGGGWYIPTTETPTELNAPVTASVPSLDANGQITGWQIHGRNISGVDRYMRAYVVCVPQTA